MSGEPAPHRKMYYLDVSLLVHSLSRHVDATAASPRDITYTCDFNPWTLILLSSEHDDCPTPRTLRDLRVQKTSNCIYGAANYMFYLFLFVEKFHPILISQYLPCLSRKTFRKPFGHYSEKRELRVL